MDGKVSERLVAKASKSVVIVAVEENCDIYCSGCVVDKARNVPGSTMLTTLVMAPAEFVTGKENDLKVVFFDKRELKATVLAVSGAFCLLSTEFHKDCEMINLLARSSGLSPCRTFMVVPRSNTANEAVRTYVAVGSLKSYTFFGVCVEGYNAVANSDKYFLVTCSYYGKTGNGINQLTAAPVFSMWGRTLGIVLQDCRHQIGDPGAEFKVALNAPYAEELISMLDSQIPGAPSKKRKRGCQ